MNTDDTVTIYDVAREAGVSMATVSRVVNGNKNVKENLPPILPWEKCPSPRTKEDAWSSTPRISNNRDSSRTILSGLLTPLISNGWDAMIT